MKKRLFFAAGAVIALSAGIVAMAHFSERRQFSELVLLNIEAMANQESYATSSSQCFQQSGWNCVVTSVSGDGHAFQDVHENFVAVKP